jgi:hypothetical protein
MSAEDRNGKRSREDDNLPSCLRGKAPTENHKRRMIGDRSSLSHSELTILTPDKFSVESNVEDDERRIEQRIKQIKFGKNTIGYDRYLAAVPK